MIQRIQTLYWLLITALLVVSMLFPIGFFHVEGAAFDNVLNPKGLTMADGTFQSTWGLFAILFLDAVVTFATIFLYKNRMLQVRMTVFSALLLIGYYAAVGVFVYMLQSDLNASFRPGWALALPLVCIIIDYLAFRATYADEVMVRAADRLR
ncbi:MAG: DUF4293 domain-containing protein [Bacteroidaceae bacterium]|nr:DUF4293 domain-containing protein [Bacteroidaceae bacterium]MBR1541158.1 DUF4293 domain-containing protein [Bacteroidaceae bacterium]